MTARLERIARMRPEDRMQAVASFIEGAASFNDYNTGRAVTMQVTYRRSRTGDHQTVEIEVVGVARNDNGTSFGELLVREDAREPHRMFGISLALLDALETVE